MRVTILGCGASGGSPGIGGATGMGDWGKCNPAEPRNRRLRASVMVEQGSTRLLVDCTPDLRTQCLKFGIGWVDAVLFTHDHADHTHGIDDLRRLFYARESPIPVYGTSETLGSMRQRFAYAFQPKDGMYQPFITAENVSGPFSVGEIDITPYPQLHGAVSSTGYRFGPIAYSTDMVGLPEESVECLAGVDTWVVDALKREPHPTHANVDMALEMIRRINPRRGVLTHMTVDLDYTTLAGELPDGIEPAYDGMVLEA